MKILFLFILFSSQLWAGPSSHSCEYYEEVETEFACGEVGYLRRFGIPLCRKYLSAEPKLSAHLSLWLQEVRFCLQDEMQKTLSSVNNCSDLKSFAMKSHVGCYVRTGYCDLSVMEKLTVVRLTSKRMFTREVLGLARKLPLICL